MFLAQNIISSLAKHRMEMTPLYEVTSRQQTRHLSNQETDTHPHPHPLLAAVNFLCIVNSWFLGPRDFKSMSYFCPRVELK